MTALLHGYASTGVGVALGLALAGLWSVARANLARWTPRLARLLRSRAGPSQFKAIDTTEIEWRRNGAHQAETTFYMRPLFQDHMTCDSLMLVRYPAGEINPDHIHTAGHGMYVLQGELVTHRGTFGHGTFVWFPANETMRHGAGPDNDLIVLFAAGPNMQTKYVKKAT